MELSEKRGVPGSVLKWVAIITMLIDHIGVVLLYGWAKYRHYWGPGIESLNFYYIVRSIGRLGFPLFCFLLAEGFVPERDVYICLGHNEEVMSSEHSGAVTMQ